jgi:hypothetical protein
MRIGANNAIPVHRERTRLRNLPTGQHQTGGKGYHKKAHLSDLADRARHAHWLNPEHRRHWDTGDSAASAYSAVVPMTECRNLTQLGQFVHDLV